MPVRLLTISYQSSVIRFLFFLFVSCSLYLTIFPKHTFAQTAINDNATMASQSAQANQFLTQFAPQTPQYANIMTINLIHTISCLAEGRSIIGQPCIDYKLVSTDSGISLIPTEEAAINGGGAMGSIANMLASVYSNPPVQVSDYVAYAQSNFGLVQPAYAQVGGSGNNVLGPIFKIWELFRNIAYLGMIFIFLVIGFMIMFRQKINSQTVLGVQQAIPGLVIGLILITFSYFLSALLVDTSFVAIHLSGKVFEDSVLKPIADSGPYKGSDTINSLLDHENVLSIFSWFIKGDTSIGPAPLGPINAVGETKNTVDAFQKDPTLSAIINTAAGVIGCWMGGKVGNFLAEVPILGGLVGCIVGGGTLAWLSGHTGIVGSLVGLVMYVVLIIALLIAMFKLLFALIQSYISILISTMFAPLQFLLGSIPGRSSAITGWLKSMVANLLVFPAVFAALIFAAYILSWRGEPFFVTGTAFQLSGGTMPLFGGLPSDFIRLILAYGILLISPTIPNMVKEAFGVKGPNFGQAAIGAVSGGFNVAKTGALRAFRAPIERRRIFRQAQNEAEVYNDERHPYPTQPQDVLSLPREFVQRRLPILTRGGPVDTQRRWQQAFNNGRGTYNIRFNAAGAPIPPGQDPDAVDSDEFNRRVAEAIRLGHPNVPTPLAATRGNWRRRRW